jgi:hypothetical protein
MPSATRNHPANGLQANAATTRTAAIALTARTRKPMLQRCRPSLRQITSAEMATRYLKNPHAYS